jgi:hypothetical protein
VESGNIASGVLPDALLFAGGLHKFFKADIWAAVFRELVKNGFDLVKKIAFGNLPLEIAELVTMYGDCFQPISRDQIDNHWNLAMNELGSQFYWLAFGIDGENSSTDAFTGFQDCDFPACGRQSQGRGQPGRTGSDDQHLKILAFH